MTETTFDFQDGRGPIAAHRHINPDKSEGGWVADTATVHVSAFVGNYAIVGDRAIVGDGAIVGDRAIVGNYASVGDRAIVGYRAHVGDGASVGDRAIVGNGASVGDRARVGDRAIVGYGAIVGDRASVGDGARVGDRAIVGDGARVNPIGQRSDGYHFFAVQTDTGFRIQAGCRNFTPAEARAHWTTTRGGTQLGEESLAFVDHAERMARIWGWIKSE